jgi:hypothetical protein
LFLLWVVSRDNIAHTVTTGWTQVYQASNGTTTQVSLWYAWYKGTAPNSANGEVNAAPTVTHSGTGGCVARICGWRGAYKPASGVTPSPIVAKSTALNATGVSVNTPGIDPTISLSTFVHFIGGGTGNTATSFSSVTGYTTAALAASTTASNTTGRAQLGAYYSTTGGTAGSAGPNGVATASVAPSSTTGWAGYIVAIRNASTTGSGSAALSSIAASGSGTVPTTGPGSAALSSLGASGSGSVAQTRVNRLNALVTTTAGVAVSATFSAFTPTANSLLVVALQGVNGPAGNISTSGLTVSGGGLTWTRAAQRGQVSALNYSSTVEIWTAPVGASPASCALTVSSTVTSDTDPCRVCVQAFDYAGTVIDASNPVVQVKTALPGTGTGAYSFTLDAAPVSGSIVVAARGITPANVDNFTADPGSGWTEIYDAVSSGGYGALETQERTGSTSTTIAWADIAVPDATVDLCMAAAIELRAVGSVPPTQVQVAAQTNAFVVWGAGPDTKTTDPITTTAGSQILVGAGVWQWDTQARDRSDPYDSKSNTYSLIGSVSRPDNWPTAAEGVWRNDGGTRGASHTFTKDFQSASEVSISVIEVLNGGAPTNYAIGHIANPGTANATLTAPTTHADGAALLFVYLYLDQFVTAPTSASGWTLVHEYQATDVSIHQAVFARYVSSAGDYAFAAQITGQAQGATTIQFSIPQAGAAVSGSGASAFASLAVAGSGAVSIVGTAAAALSALASAGAGAVTHTGSGSAALRTLAAASSGLVSCTGSGTAAMSALATSSAGTVTCSGSGSAALASIAASGSGSQSIGISGSGSAALSPCAASGTGLSSVGGSGSAALAQFASTGSGASLVTGSGSAALRSIAVAASGAINCTGSGSVSLVALAASASGAITLTGSGSAAFAPLAASGTGAQALGIAGAGSVTLSSCAASGAGACSLSGSGSVALRSLAASGAASVAYSASGTAALSPFAAAGSGSQVSGVSGSGGVVLAGLAVTGTGSQAVGIVGSGTAALSSLAASSSGLTSITGSGSIAGSRFAVTASGAIALPVSGSGSAGLSALSPAGVATTSITGSGSASLASWTAGGAASIGVSGTGSAALASLRSSGSGLVSISGSGALALSPLLATGAASVTQLAVSGFGAVELSIFTADGRAYLGTLRPGVIERIEIAFGSVERLETAFGDIERELDYG